jgi:Mg-chelatase subunit ChlD
MVAAGVASVAAARVGELRVEIHEPAGDRLFTSLERQVQVQGGASIFGGVKYLDLFLVLDTSKSLNKTDRKDYRAAGAIALVRSLPAKSDIQIGVVDFDRNAELLAPLTPDRAAIVSTLRSLDRTGATDLAAGIRAGLAGFEQGARPESSRVMLLFTDGKSNEKKAREAMQEARRSGVAIHTLLLGSDDNGTEILRGIAQGTGGSFIRVTDPSKLPEAFLGLRTTGVDHVTLSVNGGTPMPARLSGGTFSGDVPLQVGENRIVATATSLAGETRQAAVRVLVSDQLSVSIDAPLDGTLYTDRKTEALVTGMASLFANVAPELLEGHPDHGIRRVVLRVDESPPFATSFEQGRFEGRVMLHEGENRILASATATDGRVADTAVTVTVRPPGCGELEVRAQRDGGPALSLSDRAVDIVVDASGSMWGQLGGRSKMSIAKDILSDALQWLPEDLMLGLRVYGHQHGREEHNCQDSQLLVSFGPGSRERIRRAIPTFKPRGQTPLGYSLEQVAGDFGDFRGERAVVLVTDGIESCGGDPVAAARALHERSDVTVHVIGFGLGGGEDEDRASLRAIADASGGKFLSAGSAEELRDALSVTVGTAFQVTRAGAVVAEGTLGADDRFRLPAGDYTVRVASLPPHEVPVRLTPEEASTLVLERRAGAVSHQQSRRPTEYFACGEPAWARRGTAAPTHAPASPAAARAFPE